MIKRFFAIVITLVFAAAPVRAAGGTGAASAGTGEQLTPPIKIAVIDTGIATKRLDADKILEGKNYITGGSTKDLVGHGTRIASLILGADNGRNRIVGSAPEALLVPLVYSSRLPSGVAVRGGAEMIARSVRDAVDVYDCRVICISSGVVYDDEALAGAVAYAERTGAVVVAAAGNDNIRAPERVYYPAAYETVVGVGSVNSKGEISAFSQRNDGVNVYAPGEDVLTVSIRNGRFFEKVSGTSYAAAAVCGAAARLLAETPSMTPTEVRRALYDTYSYTFSG